MPRPTDWEKQEENAIRNEYAPLAGATLVEVRPARMFDGSVVAELEVKTRAGQRVVLQAWQDPEGNGPGHLCAGTGDANPTSCREFVRSRLNVVVRSSGAEWELNAPPSRPSSTNQWHSGR